MSLESTVMFLDGAGKNALAREVLDVFGKNAYSFEQFDEVSMCFFKIKDYDQAIAYGEKGYAIASTPQQMYTIRHNLINVYNHNNQPSKALRYIRANEAVMPVDLDRDFEKAFSLFLSNNKADAAALLRSKLGDATLTDEQQTKLIFNLGTYDLIDGNLQLGLQRFLKGGEKMKIWDHTTIFSQDDIDKSGFTRWDGTVIPGQNILVVAEAGIGDEVINVRFFKRLKELGMNPIWMTLSSRKDLAELYQLNGITAIAGKQEIPKDFTNFVAIPSMHLPMYLNCTYDDLWDGVYLTETDPLYDTKWQTLVAEHSTPGKKKIGVRWQGNPAYDQDLHRSVPLVDLYNALKDIQDVDFYSMQRDTGTEELPDFPGIIDLTAESKNLKDLFSFIKSMDIIVTSCTSIAHIAGAMGKEVYVWVPISCYYVWCNPTKESPWYGSNMHVIYQQKPGVWDNCIAEMQEFNK